MPCHMLKKKNGDCYHLLNAYYVAVPCLCPVTWSQWQGLWALRHGTSVWAGWGQHRNPSAVPEMLMGPSWLQMCPQISLLSVSMPFAMRLAVHLIERWTLFSTPWILVSLATHFGRYKVTMWHCSRSKTPVHFFSLSLLLSCSLGHLPVAMRTSLGCPMDHERPHGAEPNQPSLAYSMRASPQLTCRFMSELSCNGSSSCQM